LATTEKQKKSGIDQILTSVSCPRQNKHTDIKKVAYNYVRAILQRCKKSQKNRRSSSSSSHFIFPRDFSGNTVDTDIVNTLLEPLWPTDVPFWDYKTETKEFFCHKIDFFGCVELPSE